MIRATPKTKMVFKLDKNRLRVTECPCGKSNADGKFVPYEGATEYGYCHSCSKTFVPESAKAVQIVSKKIKKVKERSYVPKETLIASLKGADTNNLSKFLYTLFPLESVNEVLCKYYVGGSQLWKDATVFWQIDKDGNIRTGKVMLYDAENGKRVKKPYSHISWVHNKIDGFSLEQCFFGEHLLGRNKYKPVGIVESEKTALLCCLYFPDTLWLATGGIGHLKPTNCKPLKGRRVLLFPDLGAYDSWAEVANGLSKFCDIGVSDLLERNASDEDKGQKFDIGDFIIKKVWMGIKGITIMKERVIKDCYQILQTASNCYNAGGVDRSVMLKATRKIESILISNGIPYDEFVSKSGIL
ncbi:MAG: DUF6371 domain-containing protein [Bacteroidota bacterium]